MKLRNIIIGTLLGISSLTPLNAAGVGDLKNLGYNACYTKRRLPINYDLAFDTMKDLFLKTNINLINLSKKDGFMYGKGSWKSGDSMFNITITINFKNMGDITQISSKASYSIMKKEYDTDTGGIAGINFPMPVLWKKSYNLQDTGNIIDPNFYMGFYLNYQKVLFDNLMMNGKIILDAKPKKVEEIVEKKVEAPKKTENTNKNIDEKVKKEEKKEIQKEEPVKKEVEKTIENKQTQEIQKEEVKTTETNNVVEKIEEGTK